MRANIKYEVQQMNTVKIRSNTYKKEVSFFSLNENNEWYDIKDDNRDGKLREMSSDKMLYSVKNHMS